MGLFPGSRLGPYEVVARAGSGGMGEVYRARDTQLDRDVALKMLPDSLVHDRDRVERLRREARVLASLNHPHIGGIHGLVDQDGAVALVLEFVEGPTLADRIGGGPLGVGEALAIAKQVTGALEAAHELGIVHRDLKPANIKLRPDGTVKLLDFGLAKAAGPADLAPDASSSPTLGSPGRSVSGVVLGTASYMSPEQARGQAVDRRTDVWAFGCVLFEMLSGTRAFAGKSFTETAANVLRGEPDWNTLPASAAPLTGVLRRCLEKDPGRRLRDIGDVALLLDDALAPGDSGAASPAVARRVGWIAAAVAAGAVLGGAGVAVVARRAGPVEEPVERFQLTTPAAEPLAQDTYGDNVAISTDGSRIAYTSTRRGAPQIVVRRLDSLELTPLADTVGGFDPFFSPDGRQLGFATFTGLRRVSVEGGPSTVICPVDAYFSGATWAGDAIVFASRSMGLYRVPASGGKPERLAAPDAASSEQGYVRPAFLPGGDAILYTAILTDGSSRVMARRLQGSESATVAEAGFGGRYVPPGFVVFGQADRLMAVRFDVRRLRVSGSPVAVQQGVLTRAGDGVMNATIAANGTAVYVSGRPAIPAGRLVWLDRSGARIGGAVGPVVEMPRLPRISPDARRVALTAGPPGQGQIWVYDLAGAGQPLKLTFRDHHLFPVWSPDGKRIACLERTGSRDRMLSIAADGSSTEPAPLTNEDLLGIPLSWSPDGASLLFQQRAAQQPPGLWVLHLENGSVSRWSQPAFADFGGRLSPDGRWVAYASNRTGALEVWIRPYDGGAPVRISSEGGTKPFWSRDGKEIFYEDGAKLMSVDVVTQGELRVEPPRLLFQGGFVHDDTDPMMRFLDVAADGRFVAVAPGDAASPASIVVTRHWDEVLRRLLARE